MRYFTIVFIWLCYALMIYWFRSGIIERHGSIYAFLGSNDAVFLDVFLAIITAGVFATDKLGIEDDDW